MDFKRADCAWMATALLLLLPLAAVLHHGLFFRHMCMLNPFGNDYHASVVLDWLRHDPAPWCAGLLTILIHRIGAEHTHLRSLALAALIASAPLTLWIWDIPSTARVICRYFHDGRSILTARYLYLFAAVAWLPIWWLLNRRGRAMEPATRS